MNVRLTGIEVTLADGNKVTMTVKDAKKLYDQLHELFGLKINTQPSTPITTQPQFGFPSAPCVYPLVTYVVSEP